MPNPCLNPHLTLPFFNTVGWVNVELHLIIGSHIRFLQMGVTQNLCRTKPGLAEPELAVEQYLIPSMNRR
jgi:hypothetical protein